MYISPRAQASRLATHILIQAMSACPPRRPSNRTTISCSPRPCSSVLITHQSCAYYPQMNSALGRHFHSPKLDGSEALQWQLEQELSPDRILTAPLWNSYECDVI